MIADRALADSLRQLYPRVLAKMIALSGSLPDAEDAAQEAIARALTAWPDSAPSSPEAWLVTVASNAYRDRRRRARREPPSSDVIDALAEMSPWARIALADPDVARGWKDDLLRVLFACCHPALGPGESAALAMSTILGLSIAELSAAFVTAPRTMEQRLSRARSRLRERGDYEGEAPERSRDRLPAVLRVVHLVFNEGYWSTSDESPIRADLCRLAIGLAHSLTETFPDDAEVAGLLALLLLHDARRDARLGVDCAPIPLPEQDRTRWDRDAIARATRWLERALGRGAPGPFQLEAAISAVHCRARSADATDWKEIAALYAILESMRPTAAVRVNRAFAVGRADGPREGLRVLDEDPARVGSYPYAHVVRGALRAELGDRAAAREALTRALAVARNEHERRHVADRLRDLEAGEPT